MSSKSNGKKKQHVVLPYIGKPLLYWLISMVIVVPASLGLLKFGINYVHRAQPFFARSINEVQTDDSDFVPSQQESGVTSFPKKLKAGKKIGVLTCAPAGLTCDVYLGANRVCYRAGAGLSGEGALPGEAGTVRIKGYTAYAFKALENLKEGDEVTLTTTWGVYRYRVDSTAVCQADDAGTADLVMSCAKSKDGFATFAEKRLYVLASLVSGPTAEEVQP